MLGLSGWALYRPAGEAGPYLRASAFLDQPLRFTDLEHAGLAAGLGWQLGGSRRGALAGYELAQEWLGGDAFLTAHRLLAAGWLPAGAATLSASCAVRFESYPAAAYEPFSGALARGELIATWPLGHSAGHRLEVGYRLSLDDARRPELGWVDHGPAAEVQLRLGPRARAGLRAAAGFRTHGAYDPQLGVRRSDAWVEAGVLLAWGLDEHFTLRGSLAARRQSSSAPDFTYSRVAPSLGIALTAGL